MNEYFSKLNEAQTKATIHKIKLFSYSCHAQRDDFITIKRRAMIERLNIICKPLKQWTTFQVCISSLMSINRYSKYILNFIYLITEKSLLWKIIFNQTKMQYIDIKQIILQLSTLNYLTFNLFFFIFFSSYFGQGNCCGIQ